MKGRTTESGNVERYTKRDDNANNMNREELCLSNMKMSRLDFSLDSKLVLAEVPRGVVIFMRLKDYSICWRVG